MYESNIAGVPTAFLNANTEYDYARPEAGVTLGHMGFPCWSWIGFIGGCNQGNLTGDFDGLVRLGPLDMEVERCVETDGEGRMRGFRKNEKGKCGGEASYWQWVWRMGRWASGYGNGVLAHDARDLRNAIELFLDMELSGHALDRFTYSSVLSASTESGLLALGKQLHSQVIRLGLASDVCVGCSLVDMYAKCTADGSVDDLRKVFDRMPEHNVMSWTAIITAYVQIGECDKEAIELFCKMISGRVQPNHFSFSSVLKACGNLSDPYKHALREMEKFIR
ncbi:hypothetical protein AAG906_008859 [Vitis piasezkii]